MKSILEKYKMIRILALLGLISFGCSQSLLEYDQHGVQTKESFYKTDTQAFEALMAVFDQWQGGTSMTFFYTNIALSDEAYAGGGGRGDNSGILEELNEYRFTPTTTAIRNYYSWLYFVVNRANLVIDNVATDTSNKTIFVGMAKAMRASAYFYLVNSWGDVPLVLHELSASESSAERTPKAEVYTQIEKDLTEAIAALPVRSAMPAAYRQLLSKGSAQAMLGKAYLFEKKYAEAAAMFENVIASNEYSLYPDYSKVLRKDSEFGVESLWEVSYVTTMGYSFPGAEAWFGPMYAPRTEFLPGAVYGKIGLTNYGWGFLMPHKTLYDAYTNAGDLVRRASTVIGPNELEPLGGKYMNAARTATPYGNDGYIRLKFLPFLTEGDGPVDFLKMANCGTNFRMIRYADVLLMAAEANNRKTAPDDAKAKTYVNLVRARVQLDPLTSTGDALFAAIKTERQLELAFEGQRIFDLQRWGDAYAALKDQGKSIPDGAGGFLSPAGAGYKQGKNELLPIPEYETTVNSGMVQNPGY
jgi:hypothetical protein